MLKFLFIASTVLLGFSSENYDKKPFPKRYLGNYYGIQEKYNIKIGGETIEIPSATYTLVLDYGTIWLVTQQQNVAASYSVKAETKMYYTFTVKLESGITEEWQLWKKGRRLIRKSIAPQPDIIFLPS